MLGIGNVLVTTKCTEAISELLEDNFGTRGGEHLGTAGYSQSQS